MVDQTEIRAERGPADLWRLDRVLHHFEQSWFSDRRRTHIEDYLHDFDRYARRCLVRSLIQCELGLRQRQGDTVEKSDYTQRFPDATVEVEEVFSNHRAAAAAELQPTYSIETGLDASTTDEARRTTRETPSPQPEDIERYSVRHLHASGGLGEVYLAEDMQLNREVALKQLKTRFASDPDRRFRFLREAEITGRLEHPGVVPLYGLGSFPDGRPYYAMRFIHGDSVKSRIARYHRQETADPRQRMSELRQLLTRFVDVCQAVEYAHSRGIVHRDLKPSNIMLGEFGETLVVDWGLAKSMDDSDSVDRRQARIVPLSGDQATETEAGDVLGTPAYMSPEQATGDLQRVGAKSDIYSLGATLFEILTGEPPVAGKVVEVIEKIKTGQLRGAREVRPSVPVPLDAICRRAMAPAPEDRYPSAAELARDVESWLADEPVTAWPEPFAVRSGRWIKQHLTLVTGTLAAVVATLVASGIALWVVTGKNVELDHSNTWITIANRRLDDTNRELMSTNSQLQEANRLAAANEARAEANYQKAQDVVEEFLTDVSQSEELLAGAPGTQELRGTLLDRARQYYEDFLQLNESTGAQYDVAVANRVLGQVLYQIGETQQAEARIEAAASILRNLTGTETEAAVELANALNELGKVRFATSQFTASEQSYNESIGLFEHLGWEQLPDEARATFAQVGTNRGALLQELNRMQEAQDSYHDSIERWQRLLDAQPADVRRRGELATVQCNYAWLLVTVGQPSRAEAMSQEAIAGLEQLSQPETGKYADILATALQNLAHMYSGQERFAEAEPLQTRALRIRQGLFERNPRVTEFREAVANSHKSLANIYSRTGRASEAEAALRQSVELREQLVQLDPAVSEFQNRLASSYLDLALHYRRTGRTEEAEAYYVQALDISEALAQGEMSPEQQDSLASTYHNLGEFYRQLRRWKTSADMFAKAVSIRQSLVDEIPENVAFRSSLATSLMQYGGPLLELDLNDEAEQTFQRAIALLSDSAAESLSNKRLRSLAVAYNNLAFFYSRTGRNAEAEQPLLETQKIYEQLIREDPSVVTYHSGMAACCNNLGAIYWFLKRYDEGEQMLLRAVQANEALLSTSPESSNYRGELANAYRNLAALFQNQGGPSQKAVDYWRQAVQHLTRLVSDEPNVPPYRVRLAAALNALGLAEKRLGNYQTALEHYEEVARVTTAPGLNLQDDLEKQATLALARKAWIRATCPDAAFRDGPQAVQDATAACERSEWKDAVRLDVLAAALAETGDFEQAVQRQQAALEAAPEKDKAKYQERLERYKQQQPTRDEAP